MALETSGDSADFKTTVKSLESGDIVTVSDSLNSIVNKDVSAQGTKTVAALGVAEVMPTQAIPDGYSVVIKALNSNTAPVHLSDSKANAEDDTKSFELRKNEHVSIKLSNLDKLWIDANVNGEGVTYIVESD